MRGRLGLLNGLLFWLINNLINKKESKKQETRYAAAQRSLSQERSKELNI